jgi:hypothetical protein
LLESCAELQDRDEVAACLHDVLIDVELAATLSDRLVAAREIERLQRRVDEQKIALTEARALREQSLAQQSVMADTLLEELIQLSKDIGEMEVTKQQHQELLIQYDELMAKLMQTEDRLEEERLHNKLPPPPLPPVPQPTVTAASTSPPPLKTKGSTISDAGSQAWTDSGDEEEDRSPLVTTKKSEDSSTVDSTAATPKSGGAAAIVAVHEDVAPAVDVAKSDLEPMPNLELESPTEKAAVVSGIETEPTESVIKPVIGDGDVLLGTVEGGNRTKDAAAEIAAASAKVEDRAQIENGITNGQTITLPETKSGDEKDGVFDTAEETEGAPVVLIKDDEDDKLVTPQLDGFEMEVLMKIFAFLDALDILNTAQISRKMYSRVDTLFGLGDDSLQPQEDNSTIATNETAPAFQPTVVALPPEPAKPPPSSAATRPTAAALPTVAAIPDRKPAPTPPVAAAPTVAAVPTVAAAPTAAVASIVAATSTPPEKTGLPQLKNPLDPARGLFSMLAPRRLQQQQQQPQQQQHQQQQAPKKPPPPSTPPKPEPSGREPDLTAPPAPLPMNAAMANSMAAKLSDAELNAIILMTDRLKQNETLARKLAKEKDELVAKLEGTERVKQFLVNKVREMEVTIASTIENEAKVAQQIASDQEVIAFLDGRVHELETETRTLRSAQQESVDGLERVKEQSTQKASVMGDMLQFERERLKESEREWKATKKLLVKEVKSCRAQLTALQAERDGYREQNERLQKAVMRNSHHQNGTSGLTKHGFG